MNKKLLDRFLNYRTQVSRLIETICRHYNGPAPTMECKNNIPHSIEIRLQCLENECKLLEALLIKEPEYLEYLKGIYKDDTLYKEYIESNNITNLLKK